MSEVVAKITRYFEQNGEPATKWATKRRPAWVVGVHSNNKDWSIEDEHVLLAPAVADKDFSDDMFSLSNIDTYEIVPPEEWPDEVCAAMAKRALLGGTNNDQ